MSPTKILLVYEVKSSQKKTRTRKRKYKYNWKNSFRHLRDNIVGLFSVENAGKLLGSLVENISRSVVAIRKGRKFSRKGLESPARITSTTNTKIGITVKM
jgi:hypothetical protein